MRMNEPSRWSFPALDGAADFARMVREGAAIDVSHRAPKWLAGSRVAIECNTYDRFVAWDNDALRKHAIALDETARIEHLFDVCGCAAFGAGGCFICRSVDAQGYTSRAQRQVLTMTNYGRPTAPLWLIHG